MHLGTDSHSVNSASRHEAAPAEWASDLGMDSERCEETSCVLRDPAVL